MWVKRPVNFDREVFVEGVHDEVVESVYGAQGDIPVVVRNLRRRRLVLAKGTRLCRLTKFTEPGLQGEENLGAVSDEKVEAWRPSEHVLIDEENLTADQVSRMKALIDVFACVFSKDDTDLGQSIYSHKILLTDDTSTKSRPYRVPYKQLVRS